MKLKIAVIQMDIAFGDPEVNIQHVERKLEEVMMNRPDVVILPELWTTGYDLERLDLIGDPHGTQTHAIISALAKEYDVNIVAGSIANKKETGIYNTLFAFNRQGERVGEYSKLHLIRLMDEEKYLTPGTDLGQFEIEGIPCAGLICYDIRFPEWVRKHVLTGAQILFIPAEWPLQRVGHWRNLLITRAIENQCYVVACNRVGSDLNNTFAGHSLIIDPWGEVLAEGGEEESILFAEIDTDQVTTIRSRIPIFEDRRPELY